MVYLDEIMKRSELVGMIDQGYVRSQFSPDGSLQIFNYTDKAMYDSAWNDVTKQTRGLIIDTTTKEVVARPFRKFFNWPQISLTQQTDLLRYPMQIYSKFDGSLGILYRLHTGETAISTRGSFTSPQALHATEVLHAHYPDFEPIDGLTYLFEIIFPTNRIVVDYGSMDDLVLLAVVDIDTGKTLADGSYRWPGQRATLTEFSSIDQIREVPNAEGFVVYFPDLDHRVKIKFPEYLRLHQILTNTSARTVWAALAGGLGIEAIVDHVPDEFFEWVRKQVHSLEGQYNKVHTEACDEYDWIMKKLVRPEWDRAQRKEFALLANESPFRDVLFGLYDGKDISERIWKRIRPEYSRPFSTQPEDNA
jgi:RNA ligase